MSRKITVCDGKYTVICPDDWKNEKFECLRYGEEWRDLCGDGMVLALCHRIMELEDKVKEMETKRTSNKKLTRFSKQAGKARGAVAKMNRGSI